MDKNQLDHFRSLLDKREDELSADIRREAGKHESFVDIASELQDPGDASFADLSIDLNNSEISRDVVELRAVRAARARIEDGTYGQCSECGIDIPLERLEVQPTAERCAPCQENFEKTHAQSGRGPTI